MNRLNQTQHPRDPSWWLEEALMFEGNPSPAEALEGMITADVLIVGGGLAGLWTANTLKDRDASLNVVLIEADICGGGASGKNGGMVSGFWSRLPKMTAMFGETGAMHVATTTERAQAILRAFAASNGTDLWFISEGSLRISTHVSHDADLEAMRADAVRLKSPKVPQFLTRDQVNSRYDNPAFRCALQSSDGGNIHPARLTRALRRFAINKGVRIYERTPLTALERRRPHLARTPHGTVTAKEIVLTMNTGLTIFPELQRHIAMLSSFVLITEPIPERLAAMNWTGQEGLMDARVFLRYARKTPDDRVLVGWTGGPVGFAGNWKDRRLRESKDGARGLIRGMEAFLPALKGAPVARMWGGGIDVSPDRLPFFKTFPGTRIHYAGGFSGHGVNATCLAGQTLASLVQERRDEWTESPLATRQLDRLPPEPLRYLAASAIRWGVLACEDAAERGLRAPFTARCMASLPKYLGLKIGTR